ncbi:hypothetical protein O181_104911 [Austropuccinia psidii MF-1]|uniref:Uncharacterized protein n=1 Tax=Austropuccinia psidii MF-1 TaxID=1389203 RepID=A0A9Q3JNI2_9BASI|nr:hypothetical protein [Austropuccinia psidii MF-1]
MPVQNSPPARQTRSQGVVTPTTRAPLIEPSSSSTEGTLRQRTKLGRVSTIQEGRKRSKKIEFIFTSSWRFARDFRNHF